MTFNTLQKHTENSQNSGEELLIFENRLYLGGKMSVFSTNILRSSVPYPPLNLVYKNFMGTQSRLNAHES